MPKRIVILGSTGSIGHSALSVVDNLPAEFEVVGLAAGSRWEMLAEQVARYRPRVAVLADESAAANLRRRMADEKLPTDVLGGPQAIARLVKEVDCDFVLSGIVGVAGLPATLAAVQRGLTVGLVNKESLVVAGELMIRAAKESGGRLIPVDSEHSAIYQSLHAGRHDEIERIFLTSSGGPFRTWSTEKIRTATLADAMRHPIWNMGPKITIDSATMMNKALEIVEARWLFGVDPDRIEVVIHPESIIHSMVAFHDGSVVAQMGSPDMRTPIQYAMTYPRRLAGCTQRLDFSKLERMHFEPPDPQRFPALRLGQEVARAGGTAGAAMNAANEAAVDLFRNGRIRFADIVPMVEDAVAHHSFIQNPSLETLMETDARARSEVAQCCPV